jgi:hypothetical protein
MKFTRIRQSKIEDLEIGHLKIGQVKSFKYLGATVNEDNSIEEYIRVTELTSPQQRLLGLYL